jgi:hypothetical protein
MQITITYNAPDIYSLVSAIQAVRALGLAPTVSVAQPAPRSTLPTPKGAKGENVATWTGTKGEKFFKRSTWERGQGWDDETAATRRMEVPRWQELTTGQINEIQAAGMGMEAPAMEDESAPPMEPATPYQGF